MPFLKGQPGEAMILYKLSCDADHRFESWFRDSAGYDDQMTRGLLTCPVCRSPHVVKTIMAPAVVGGRGQGVSTEPRETNPSPGVSLLDEKRKEMRAFLKGVRDKILSEGHNVGARFPDQARRMHDGEIPRRPIHGEATPNEARGLLDDGIMILPIPILPEELN